MSQQPHPFPDEVVTILDDVTAWQIIESFGILDHFLTEELPTEGTVATIYEEHPTHWCLCARITGNPDPTENGFMIRAFPKNQVQLAGVVDLLNRYFKNATKLTCRPIWPGNKAD